MGVGYAEPGRAEREAALVASVQAGGGADPVAIALPEVPPSGGRQRQVPHSKVTRRFIEEQDRQIQLVYLRMYSSELNADEQMWNYAKRELGN